MLLDDDDDNDGDDNIRNAAELHTWIFVFHAHENCLEKSLRIILHRYEALLENFQKYSTRFLLHFSLCHPDHLLQQITLIYLFICLIIYFFPSVL